MSRALAHLAERQQQVASLQQELRRVEQEVCPGVGWVRHSVVVTVTLVSCLWFSSYIALRP